VSVIPEDLDDNALLVLAKRSLEQNNPDKSEAIYRKLIEKFPNVVELRVNLGATHRRQNRLEAAIDVLGEALRLSPSHPGALFNLANALRENGDSAQAEIRYLECIDIASGFVDAYLNLSDLYGDLDRYDEAKYLLTKATEFAPDDTRIWNNLGNTCKELGEFERAETHLSLAIELAPDVSDYYRNLAGVHFSAGNDRAALETINQTLKRAPEDPEAHCLRAFIDLSMGEFQSGWREYAWRWKSKEHQAPRPFPFPVWDGTDLVGKSILIWGEQGIGDEIMYASILPDLLETGARVLLECDPRLVALLSRSFPEVEVFARQSSVSKVVTSSGCDFQMPIGDLAAHFRNKRSDFIVQAPFLTAASARKINLRNGYRVLAHQRVLVGIAWKSGAGRTGKARSLAIEELLPILRLENACFINLQYGDIDDDLQAIKDRCGIHIHVDPTIDQMTDIDGFAAQIAALDLIITAANTTVHVAGGLGVQTEVLVPGVADWRWLRKSCKSIWYPSVRLHRRDTSTDPSEYLNELVEIVNSKYKV